LNLIWGFETTSKYNWFHERIYITGLSITTNSTDLKLNNQGDKNE
jgi:hypothetical protein